MRKTFASAGLLRAAADLSAISSRSAATDFMGLQIARSAFTPREATPVRQLLAEPVSSLAYASGRLPRWLLTLLLPVAFGLYSCAVVSEVSPLSATFAAREPAFHTLDPVAPELAAEVSAVTEHLSKQRTGLADVEVVTLARTLVEETHNRKVSLSLALSVIEVESGYDNFAVSQVGAMGLMQLLPSTAQEVAERIGLHWHGPFTLFNPIANVKLGVAYLEFLMERYDRIPIALAAYNWGPGHISSRLRRGATIPHGYAQKVLHAQRNSEIASNSAPL